MLRKIINNTNEKDELFYSNEVEKSKLILDLRVITERYRNEVKDRILTCIEICSTDTFDNEKTINEILLLLTDEVIIKNMDSIDIASLYQNLWENYFLMWEFEEVLKCYNKSFSLWNKKIYEKIISINIFLTLPYKEQKDLDKGDVSFSKIFTDIEEDKDNYDFWEEMQADLEEFFEWGLDFIDDAETLQSHIYNLEIMEEKWTTELQTLNYTNKVVYNRAIEKLEKVLYDSYMKIAKGSNHNDYVYLSMWNMVQRLKWEDIDYLEHWRELRKFVAVWYEFLEVFYRNWNNDDLYKVLEFIVWNSFNNLWDSQKMYIIKNLKTFIKNKNDLDFDILNKILLNATYAWSMWYTTMMEMWDIFLEIGKYGNSFSFYYAAKDRWFDLNDRLSNLLKTMLLNKDFSWDSSFNSEFILSELIQKIEENKDFTFKDMEKIKHLCNQ